jgi:hemerythrin
MAIEWTEDLSTSVVEIDNQHKEIFNRMAGLYSACRMGKGKAEIAGVIVFLEDYVTTHFDTEERYMQEYDYPGYASHKSEHISFIRTIVELKRQFETEGPSLSIVIKTNLEIAEWLKKHIREVDKVLGVYFRNQDLQLKEEFYGKEPSTRSVQHRYRALWGKHRICS